MSSERHEPLIPILFVDDEPDTRRAFAREMAARGFEVDLAADATEALQLATRREYASIATDLNMPGLNGLRLIERLRELQQSTTYILVTGVRDLNLPRSLSADCITSVVTKPWDAEELAQCIWHGVQLRRERETGWYEPAT